MSVAITILFLFLPRSPLRSEPRSHISLSNLLARGSGMHACGAAEVSSCRDRTPGSSCWALPADLSSGDLTLAPAGCQGRGAAAFRHLGHSCGGMAQVSATFLKALNLCITGFCRFCFLVFFCFFFSLDVYISSNGCWLIQSIRFHFIMISTAAECKADWR